MRQRYINVPGYLEDLHNAFDLEKRFACLVGERNSGGKAILDEIRLEIWGRVCKIFHVLCCITTYSHSYPRRRFEEFHEELSHVHHRQFKQAMKNHPLANGF
jgi:hypothetical protein